MKKQWMVAGAAVLAVGVAAPWAVGYVTEQQWQRVTADVNQAQPLFKLQTRDYDRGYMGAEFAGTITIQDPDTGDEHSFDYQARVSHGVTGSLIDFTPPPELGAEVEKIFPDEKPRLTLETRLWGTAIAELSVPAVSVIDEETGESFDMSESFSRAEISGNGSQADILMLWPGAVIRGPDLRISIEDFRLEQTMEHLTGDVWLGDGDMSLARLEVAARGEPTLRFDDFSMSGETTTDDDGKSIDSEAVVTLEKVTADDESFGPHRMEMVLSGLDVQNWSDLTTAMTDMQAAALNTAGGDSSAIMQQQMESMNRINQAMLGLAANGFSFGFPELGMQVAPLIKQGMVVQEGDRLRIQGTLEDLALDINGNVIPLPPIF